MKRIISLIFTFLILCSLRSPAFAAEVTDGNDVVAKYTTSYEDEYRAEVKDGKATAGDIAVAGAPKNAVTLVVVPMENDALEWIDGCVDNGAIVAYDIHFLDADGNRINASGAKVSVAVSGTDLTVSAVNTSGIDMELASELADGTVSFITDGSHYYVISMKTGGNQPDPGDDPVIVPVRGDENELHADVSVDGDTVKLNELDFEEIDHVVGDKDKDGLIEIDLTELDEDVCKIILPVTSIEYIVNEAEETHNEHEALQVDFPHGSVKLDDKTMRAVVEQAECDEIILVLEEVGETRLNEEQEAAVKGWNVYGGYEAYLFCVKGNKRISDFEGGVATLSVPFEIPNGLKAENFAVWYVADDGTTEKLETWYEDSKLWWSVDHFSDFIIVYEGDEMPTTPDGSQNGDSTMFWPWGVLCAVFVGIIFFLIFWKRRKRGEEQANNP